MILRLSAFAAVALALASCNSRSYTVSGTLPDDSFDGKTVYMYAYVGRNGATAVVDSTVADGRAFTFTGRTNASLQRYIDAGGKKAGLFIEPGVVTVDMTTAPAVVTGTPLNDSMTVFRNLINDLTDRYDARIDVLRSSDAAGPQTDSLRRVAWDEYRAMSRDLYDGLFRRNTDNALGEYAFWRLAASLETDGIDSLYALAGPVVREAPLVRSIMDHVGQIRNTTVGKPFVDFKAEDAKGEAVSLSDYVGKGKYVLADFWASWCAPCRAGIPAVAEAYAKYRDAGLEVIGVAVWDKRGDALKAIGELNMTWPQLIAGKDDPARLYGIEGIPHLILFAPDGTIAVRGIEGVKLDQTLQKYLSSGK